MSQDAAGATLLLVGVMLARIASTDVYQRYVKASLGPWLLLSGVLLAALGAFMVVRALRRPVGEHDHAHDQDGEHPMHTDRIGWLLLAPVLTLLLVAPPALGSFGVGRTAGVDVGAGGQVWRSLPASPTPRPMTVLELNQRANDRRGASLAPATVLLTGFVSAGGGTSFTLARYQIACCAADAVAATARVTGISGTPPTRDSWVRVTARFTGTTTDGTPVVRASVVQAIAAPVDPYE